ncbi:MULTISPECIES: phage major capsid protein [Bacillus]|uniref:phage major capsid protein n=1 Tax=Bacillus TaxID=1386 RepID=UPI0003002A5B|nr:MULTISPECIES: phage major capsid protein [Bacillus]
MDKIKELLNKRSELLLNAEALINEGKIEEFNAIETQVKELDNEIEAAKLANANLKALQENKVVLDLENKSIQVEGAKQMENIQTNVLPNEVVYTNAFAKTLMGQELTSQENSIFMEMNNHTTLNSGVMIPATTLNEIITEIEAQAPFFADARKFQVTGLLKLPKHTAITAGDAKAYLESEATEVEKNTFVEISLGGKEIAKYIEVSFKVESMSISAFLEYLKGEIVERVGVELGRQSISGNGVKEMTGVLTALASVTAQRTDYTAATGIGYKDLTAAMSKLGAKHVSSAVMYASNATVWNNLANITDTTERPLFITDTTAGGVGRVLGVPVKVDSAVPDGTVIIGNAKGYVVNTNEALSVESTRDIKARKTGFSAYTVVDGNVTHEKAFSIIAPSA